MRKRRVARRRRFYGVLRWFSVLLIFGMMFVSIPLPVGTDAADDLGEIVVPTEATEPHKTEATEPVQNTPGLVTLVHTTTYQPEQTDPEDDAPEKVEYLPLYTEADAIALAKMGWGEALVTGSGTEIAATMWCALNRFDCGDPYYRNCKTIESIVKQSGAFSGYRASNPVDEHLLWLAYDVLDRWNAEQYGETDVGRVLPPEYLFFHGDGSHNHFRVEYEHNGQYYDWSLESPYES